MQWSRMMMDFGLGRRAYASTFFVEKNNHLLTADGIHVHHRGIALTDRRTSTQC